MLKVAFDTSVLIAGLVEPHPFHRRALPWLEAASTAKLQGLVATHGLAELWAVLTKLPIDPAISPSMATAATQRLSAVLRIVAVPTKVYWKAIERCSERNLRSGALYDALHLLSAEASSVDAFLTFNAADFERLSCEDGPRVLVPPDPPRVYFDLPD